MEIEIGNLKIEKGKREISYWNNLLICFGILPQIIVIFILSIIAAFGWWLSLLIRGIFDKIKIKGNTKTEIIYGYMVLILIFLVFVNLIIHSIAPNGFIH
jgi:hypothetical protein